MTVDWCRVCRTGTHAHEQGKVIKREPQAHPVRPFGPTVVARRSRSFTLLLFQAVFYTRSTGRSPETEHQEEEGEGVQKDRPVTSGPHKRAFACRLSVHQRITRSCLMIADASLTAPSFQLDTHAHDQGFQTSSS